MNKTRVFKALWIVLTLCGLLTGHAAASESPACALLTDDEAILALRGAPEMKDGGLAKAGYSDCAWSRSGATISLLYWSRDRFAEGAPGAAEHYAGLVARLIQRGLPITAIKGLGEQAFMIDESSGGLTASTILMLKAGQVVQLSQRGVGPSDALDAVRAVAVKLRALDDLVGAVDVPEPPDGAVPPAAEQPRDPAAEPAPVGEAAAPAPETESGRSRVPVRPTDTAACALLTTALIQAALGTSLVEMLGGGVEGPGDSACAWRDAASRAYVAVNLVEGEAISAVATDANAYFGQLDAPQPGNGIERLGGVGEAAYLAVIGEGDTASHSFSILANGKVAFLDIAGANRPAALKLAQTVAGAM
jgi:hypothetical protein